MKKAVIIILAIVLAACSNKDIDNLPEIVRVNRVIPYHIVKESESVGSIAEKYSMTRAELIKVNNLTPPYQLYKGQRLIIKVKVDTDISSIASDKDTTTTQTIVTTEKEERITIPTNEQESNIDTNKKEENTEIPETEYVWPIQEGKSKISKKFNGIDDGEIIIQASAGTIVRAIADGVVKLAKALEGEASSYGNTIIILHSKQSKLSVYSHLKEFTVKEGQRVKKGTIIGKVGKTGSTKNPQLCLQIYDVNRNDKSKKLIDPEDILP